MLDYGFGCLLTCHGGDGNQVSVSLEQLAEDKGYLIPKFPSPVGGVAHLQFVFILVFLQPLFESSNLFKLGVFVLVLGLKLFKVLIRP